MLFKKAPKDGDILVFNSGDESFTCPIQDIDDTKFSIQFPSETKTATYSVVLKRNLLEKKIGKIKILINHSGTYKPAATTSVWGYVRCGTKPLANVVVSDGIEVTKTNADGIYELDSDKKWGYVFISVPSGYQTPINGVLPMLHLYTEKEADAIEQIDFELESIDSPDEYKILFFGDMHLADRTSDLKQFKEFTDDVQKYVKSNPGTKFYAITLGDMTWDLYWYSKNFCFPQYLREINTGLAGISVFHTMGNHDNDYKAFSDFDAAVKYTNEICPTYYSFNLGKVHYVVLDDIDCSQYDGSTLRKYSKTLSNEQLEWLKKDLSYVPKSTPLIIMSHAQFFYPKNNNEFKIDHDQQNTIKFFNTVKGYTVHLVTGHTHTIFNATPEETRPLGADNIYEHNAGAVCASWWWSGHLTDGIHLSPDGTPGGYSIWDVNGTDFKWVYKATNWDESYQFRAYDLNNVSFSYDDVPKMPSKDALVTAFDKYVKAYPGNHSNEVLINIWNWNSDWTLSVKDETGKELSWKKTTAYDPVHIEALSVKRFNNSGLSSVPSFITDDTMPHFFLVKADNPDVDLTIKVTDEFGNTYTENMSRPKAFNISDYKK